LAPDQEWCLNCGAAVSTRVAPTPRWRVPVVLVGTLLALLVAALVLALVELSGDPQPVAKAPAPAPTPAAAAPAEDGGGGTAPAPGTTPVPTPGASVTPAPSVTPGASGTPAPGSTPAPGATPSTTAAVAEWPAGRSAWTVLLASTKSRTEAERKARAKPGSGVLHSDDFTSLRKGYWVVFSGQYDTRKAAESAAKASSGDAYARRVVPR
jgi:septal ring-binding cell division protein DamX